MIIDVGPNVVWIVGWLSLAYAFGVAMREYTKRSMPDRETTAKIHLHSLTKED